MDNVVDKIVAKVEQTVSKVFKLGESAEVGALQKFADYTFKTLKQISSVASITRKVTNTLAEWVNAEPGLRGVLNILKSIISDLGLDKMVLNMIKSNDDLIKFGLKVKQIASKVVNKAMEYVPVVDQYLTKAESILTFTDKFDHIEGIVENVKEYLGLTKNASMPNVVDAPWCRRNNRTKPDLCVTRNTITPKTSLYKKLGFPLEMMFLNMLSTKDILSDKVFTNKRITYQALTCSVRAKINCKEGIVFDLCAWCVCPPNCFATAAIRFTQQ